MGRQLRYTLVGEQGATNLTVYRVGDVRPYMADATHPLWDDILVGVIADDVSILEKFDLGVTISKRFALSGRVSYAEGQVLFDNDPVDNSLSQHIVRTYEADEDFAPLVALFENIQANPSPNSREQMFSFLRANEFTITKEGMIVGYKGVYQNDDGDGYRSSSSGPAIINGVSHTGGPVPQKIGDVIEMPRGSVVDNPNDACNVGLHVATFNFASGFVYCGKVLEVEVHPRDIVSVPNDSGAQKVRTCRYKVVGEVERAYDTPIKPDEPVEAEVFTAGPTEPEYQRMPTVTAFTFTKLKARKQKKGLRSIAESNGWTLVDGDGSKREHWHT